MQNLPLYLDLTWINSFLRLHCQNKINKKDFNRKFYIHVFHSPAMDLFQHSLKLTVIIIMRLKFCLHFKFLMQRKRIFTFIWQHCFFKRLTNDRRSRSCVLHFLLRILEIATLPTFLQVFRYFLSCYFALILTDLGVIFG